MHAVVKSMCFVVRVNWVQSLSPCHRSHITKALYTSEVLYVKQELQHGTHQIEQLAQVIEQSACHHAWYLWKAWRRYLVVVARGSGCHGGCVCLVCTGLDKGGASSPRLPHLELALLRWSQAEGWFCCQSFADNFTLVSSKALVSNCPSLSHAAALILNSDSEHPIQ